MTIVALVICYRTFPFSQAFEILTDHSGISCYRLQTDQRTYCKRRQNFFIIPGNRSKHNCHPFLLAVVNSLCLCFVHRANIISYIVENNASSPFVGSFICWTKNPFTNTVPEYKTGENILIFLHEILQKKHDQSEVLSKDFHLNGHTQEFHPHTQMLEPPYTV